MPRRLFFKGLIVSEKRERERERIVAWELRIMEI